MVLERCVAGPEHRAYPCYVMLAALDGSEGCRAEAALSSRCHPEEAAAEDRRVLLMVQLALAPSALE